MIFSNLPSNPNVLQQGYEQWILLSVNLHQFNCDVNAVIPRHCLDEHITKLNRMLFEQAKIKLYHVIFNGLA